MRRINPLALLWLILYAVPLCFAASTAVSLTSQVFGILPSANGGTANAYFAVSGPASSVKTYTFANANSTIPVTVCSGTISLPTSAISSGGKYGASSSTPLQTACTGLLTSDNIKLDFASDPSGATGYAPSANGTLTIIVYPDSGGGNIDLYLYNDTASSVTPGTMTLNYHVWR